MVGRYEPGLVIVGFLPNEIADIFLGRIRNTRKCQGYLLTRQAMVMGSVGLWALQAYAHRSRVVTGTWMASQRITTVEYETDDLFVGGATTTRMIASSRKTTTPEWGN